MVFLYFFSKATSLIGCDEMVESNRTGALSWADGFRVSRKHYIDYTPFSPHLVYSLVGIKYNLHKHFNVHETTDHSIVTYVINSHRIGICWRSLRDYRKDLKLISPIPLFWSIYKQVRFLSFNQFIHTLQRSPKRCVPYSDNLCFF